MYVVVGSTALEYFGYNRRKPKDLDVWVDNDIIFKTKGDFHFNSKTKLIPNINNYATPDAVYTIKCSHFAWNIHWEKTKQDILWLKNKGCKLIPNLYLELKDYWEIQKGDKSFLSLNRGKKDFFDDNVTYVYDHDYLHELVANPNKPMYTKVLKEGHEVLVDKNKFDKLSFEEQIKMFTEEIVVIAAERWLINPYNKGKYSWFQAYLMSLKKTITSLTKGWAADFIIHNLEYFVKPKYYYFKKLEETYL